MRGEAQQGCATGKSARRRVNRRARVARHSTPCVCLCSLLTCLLCLLPSSSFLRFVARPSLASSSLARRGWRTAPTTCWRTPSPTSSWRRRRMRRRNSRERGRGEREGQKRPRTQTRTTVDALTPRPYRWRRFRAQTTHPSSVGGSACVHGRQLQLQASGPARSDAR